MTARLRAIRNAPMKTNAGLQMRNDPAHSEIRQAVKTIILIAIIVIVAVVAFGLWVPHRRQKLRATFDQFPLRAPKATLVGQLGAPWKDGKCGQMFRLSLSACADEVIYASPFAPLVPEYWVFQFDKEGRLIDKCQWDSP